VVRIPDGLCPAPNHARADELPIKSLAEYLAVSIPSCEVLLTQTRDGTWIRVSIAEENQG